MNFANIAIVERNAKVHDAWDYKLQATIDDDRKCDNFGGDFDLNV
jgi:hypothetical protein